VNQRKVFPVDFKWNDGSWSGQYFIVALDGKEAEEIAYQCVAANIHSGDNLDYGAYKGREVAKVWVQEQWAGDTISEKSGLVGSGDPIYRAAAYARFITETGRLY